MASEETAKKFSRIVDAQAMGQEMVEEAAKDEVSWKRGADEVSWKRG